MVLLMGGSIGGDALDTSVLIAPALERVSRGPAVQVARAGHSATLLPDGRILVLGGFDRDDQPAGRDEIIDPRPAPLSAAIYDPETGSSVLIPRALKVARAYHTATLLPSGKILVAGGRDQDGEVAAIEIFDPGTGESRLSAARLAVGRSGHAAVLRQDARVWLIGGRSAGRTLASIEVYDASSDRLRMLAAGLQVGRAEHTATSLPSGEVLIAGGAGPEGLLSSVEWLAAGAGTTSVPGATGTYPPAGASGASLGTVVSVRFSAPLDVTSLRTGAMTLEGPHRAVAGTLTPAEGGLYAFFAPEEPLEPATMYVARLRGLRSVAGRPVEPFFFSFTTGGERSQPVAAASDPQSEDAGPNNPPVVSAGPDLTVQGISAIPLAGAATDDSLPSPPGALTITWSKVSGPGTATFASVGLAATSVSFSQGGVYVLRLSAYDGQYTATDDVQVSASIANDFHADMRADVLWRHSGTGEASLWAMNGTAIVSDTPLSVSPDLGWKAQGIGDFDGNGKADILWRNQGSGEVVIWLMNGATFISGASVAMMSDLRWAVRGVGDCDGDGKADIVWRQDVSGEVVVWLMNGVTIRPGSVVTPLPDLSWDVAGMGDFNGDLKADILWRHSYSNQAVVWFMNGVTYGSGAVVPGLAEPSYMSVLAVADFNRDRRADVLWRNTATGELIIRFGELSATASGPRSAITPPQNDLDWSFRQASDFNGDGADDLLWRIKSQDKMIVWLMNGASVTAQAEPGPLGDPNRDVTGTAFNWLFGTLLTPTISPGPGQYDVPPNVSVAGQAGSILNYTLDGLDPGLNSPRYTQPFTLQKGGTVKARAFRPNWAPSAIASSAYTLKVATPTIVPPAGTYALGQLIQVTTTTPGAVIRYSTDGSDPTESHPAVPVASPLLLQAGYTLKVRAFKSCGTLPGGGQACVPSDQVSADYTLSSRGTVLLVHGGATPNPDDMAVQNRLIRAGFTVTLKQDTAAASGDANGKVAVLVSVSVSDASVNTKFQATTTPVITWEPLLYDDLKMTTAAGGTSSSQTSLSITNPAHPLAGGVSATAAVTSSPTSFGYGTPLASGTVIATIYPAGQTAVFGYEAGASTVTSFTLPGRRVALFNAGAFLNTRGWALFDAAVNWATQPRPRALLVTGNTALPLGVGDRGIADRLAMLGFSVTRLPSGSLGTNPAAGMTLVVISSTAVSSEVGTTFRDVLVPVVTWNHNLFPILRMTGSVLGTDYGLHTPAVYQFYIIDSNHPLAGGLPPGNSAPTPNPDTFAWGAWATNPKPAMIGSWGLGSSHIGVFGFGRGDAVIGTGNPTAPERRVGLFLRDNTASMDPLVFWPDGWRLVEAAMTWATGGDADGDGLTTFQEAQWGTNPENADTNGDGVSDGTEVAMGFSPTSNDVDGDGLTYAQELLKGTNPFRADTDGDGVLDGIDAFPLDPTRWQTPTDPTPGVPPIITLQEPTNAVLQSCNPPVPGCP